MCIYCGFRYGVGSTGLDHSDSALQGSMQAGLDDGGVPGPVYGAPVVPLPFVGLDIAYRWLRTGVENAPYDSVSWTGATIDYAIPNVAAGPLVDGDPANVGIDDEPLRTGYTAPTATFVTRAETAFEIWDEYMNVALNRTAGDGNVTAVGRIQMAFESTTATAAQTYRNNTVGSTTNQWGGTNRQITGSVIGMQSTDSRFNADNDYGYGEFGFETLLHEIGHSLGLSHAGAYNSTINPATQSFMQQDNVQYTIMSYNRPGTYYSGSGADSFTNGANWGTVQSPNTPSVSGRGLAASTPMVYDISVIQSIYGADLTTRTGNNTYGFGASGFATTPIRDAHSFSTTRGSVFSIWDAGTGVDTLNASDFDHATESLGAFINLFDGGYSNIGFEAGNSGTRLLGNVGIAFGAIIENAIGTHDNDSIWGNNVGNVLRSGDGDDTIFGFDGNDTIEGGAGADYIDGGAGTDYASYASSNVGLTIQALSATQGKVIGGHGGDTLYNIEGYIGSSYDDRMLGHGGADQFEGGSGADQLDGGGGDDQLLGGFGDDTMRGGLGRDYIDGGPANEGSDWALFSEAPAGISFDMTDLATGKVAINGGDGAGDTIVNIENVEGTAYADRMVGDARNNIFVGGGGNDSLYGGLGNDTLSGGTGADSIDGGTGDDVLSFRGAGSSVTIERSTGKIFGGGWEDGDTYVNIDYFEGSEFADRYTGDEAVDEFSGFGGNDDMRGYGGADRLIGEDGNDTIEGGNGADLVQGGRGADTAVYSLSGTGVTIDLGNVLAGKVTGHGGEAEGDTIVEMENIVGSGASDLLIGDAQTNVFDGGGGADILRGAGGDDVIAGGGGIDLIAGEAGNDDLSGGTENDVIFGDRAFNGAPTTTFKSAGQATSLSNPLNIGSAMNLGADPDVQDSATVPYVTISAAASNTVDYYAINVATAGAVLTIDVDRTGGTDDTVIRLLNSQGTQVGYNDDSPTTNGAGGSSTSLNSFLQYVVLTAGTYIIEVGRFNSSGAPPIAFNANSSYELQVSLQGDTGAGSDTLSGGAGGDYLDGGAGSDFASYLSAAAAVTARLDNANLNAGDAAGDSYVSIEGLIGSGFGDVLGGNGEANSLYGNVGNDTVDGGAGHDNLFGGLGADSHVGGAGFDYARYDEAFYGDIVVSMAAPSLGTGAAAGDSFDGVEGLILGSGNDWAYGDAGANYIYSQGGNDNLFGGLGADHLNGGAGFDYARFDDAFYGDIIVSLAAPSLGTGAAAGDSFAEVEGLILGGGNDFAYGDTGDNFIYGQGGNDNLFGGLGADHLNGGAGFDYARYDDAFYGDIVVSLAAPSLGTGAAAGDSFDGIEGLIMGAGADRAYGDAGANYLYGQGGNDNLFGGLGGDYIDGGDGFDYVRFDDAAHAGLVCDFYEFGSSTGAAFGDIYANLEGMILTGNGDVGRGDSGGNFLYGQGGADALDGRGGADYLDGGIGNDTLTGGSGEDVYVFHVGYNRDEIADFNGGTGANDRIEMIGVFANFAAVIAASTAVGADTEIRRSATDVLVLKNFYLGNFAADDVIL